MEALRRLLEAVLRGVRRGWNPDDPIGLDPETILGQRRAGGVFHGPAGYLNEAVGAPFIAAGDAALRGGNALLHGGAALAGRAVRELGASQGMGRRLERDLLGLAEMGPGHAGGLGEAFSAGRAAAAKARQAAARRFVRGADGSVDLGRIGAQVEAASQGRYRQGPIRMRRGAPGRNGYGVRHISPDKHRRARDLGYADGVELIRDVAKNHDVVVEQVNGRLMLVKRDGANRYAIAEYREGEGWKRLIGKNDPYYSVVTGFPENQRHIGKKTEVLNRTVQKLGGRKLWEKEP